MPRQALGVMTESMFYTILAFQDGPRCGTEIEEFVEGLTNGRVQLGPGTLYTILSKFLEVGYLREVSVEGRKRTYEMTSDGRKAFEHEITRMQLCLKDAQTAAAFAAQEGDDPNERKKPFVVPSPLPAL